MPPCPGMSAATQRASGARPRATASQSSMPPMNPCRNRTDELFASSSRPRESRTRKRYVPRDVTTSRTSIDPQTTEDDEDRILSSFSLESFVREILIDVSGVTTEVRNGATFPNAPSLSSATPTPPD